VDGKIINEKNALFPATSTGFQYGAGLFETLKVENGNIFRLDEHVLRFNTSWQQLFNESAPDITWPDVIDQLIRENDMKDKIVSIKILGARDENKTGEKFYLAAFVKPYVHRLLGLKKKGLDLITYPHPRQTPLADHKSLNYLYYYQAGAWAKGKDADEALILNPDQTVSETNTCNLLIVLKDSVILPVSDHVLSGVTLKAVVHIFKNKGFAIKEQKISRQELDTFSNVILTNSLMGAVKVLSIDGKPIQHEMEICDHINELLFG